MDTLLTLSRAHQPKFLKDLAELVAIDSGSYSPDSVNRVADWVERRLQHLGFSVERVPLPPAHGHRMGDVLVARRQGRLPGRQGGRRILLAAHMDTVFEDGTAAERPFTLQGSLAHGPGVSDDKGGLVAGLAALEILIGAEFEDYAELVFLATPDEEIGSPASKPVIEETASGMHYGARENGDLVIARKGVADFRLTVTGRAAHAGIEPERGANASLAAAHLVIALQALNGHWDDVTLNVGVVRAGSRPNIVCPEAELLVEIRSATAGGMRKAAAAIAEAAARSPVPGTSVAESRWTPARRWRTPAPPAASSAAPRTSAYASECPSAPRQRAESAMPTPSPARKFRYWTASDRSAAPTTARRSGWTSPPSPAVSPCLLPSSPTSSPTSATAAATDAAPIAPAPV